MSLFLRVRGAGVIATALVATLIGLILPGTAMAATPSPAGATMAVAVFLAMAVPVAVAWGCARGDERLEAVSVRPIRMSDLALAAAAVGLGGLFALVLYRLNLAQAGAVTARAMFTYLGFMLLAAPFVGWRIAPVLPTTFLLFVAVFGRGEDIAHPAAWAWIAAEGGDPGSWVLTIALLVCGVLAYVLVRRKTDVSPGDG